MIPEGLEVRRVLEWELPGDEASQVEALLRSCFPGYPPRTYFKLPPQVRLLARRHGELVGQAGLEHRVLRVGGLVARTFGLSDLCVGEAHRSRGIATALLEETTDFARSRGVDFVVLFADRHDLYLRTGWSVAANRCSWLKVDEHRTLGVAPATSLEDCLMVKPVGELAWPTGDVDMLGHIF